MSFYNPQERQDSHENLFAELQSIKIYKAKNVRNGKFTETHLFGETATYLSYYPWQVRD